MIISTVRPGYLSSYCSLRVVNTLSTALPVEPIATRIVKFSESLCESPSSELQAASVAARATLTAATATNRVKGRTSRIRYLLFVVIGWTVRQREWLVDLTFNSGRVHRSGK